MPSFAPRSRWCASGGMPAPARSILTSVTGIAVWLSDKKIAKRDRWMALGFAPAAVFAYDWFIVTPMALGGNNPQDWMQLGIFSVTVVAAVELVTRWR